MPNNDLPDNSQTKPLTHRKRHVIAYMFTHKFTTRYVLYSQPKPSRKLATFCVFTRNAMLAWEMCPRNSTRYPRMNHEPQGNRILKRRLHPYFPGDKSRAIKWLQTENLLTHLTFHGSGLTLYRVLEPRRPPSPQYRRRYRFAVSVPRADGTGLSFVSSSETQSELPRQTLELIEPPESLNSARTDPFFTDATVAGVAVAPEPPSVVRDAGDAALPSTLAANVNDGGCAVL